MCRYTKLLNARRHAVWLMIILAVSLVRSPALSASDPGKKGLRDELAIVAAGLAKAVKEFGHEAIAVGEFTGPAQLPTSGGPLIAETLSEELRKAGLTVKRIAAIGVKGEYQDIKDKETGLLAAQIRGTVTDRSGKVLFSFNRAAFGDAIVASLFGVTAKLPPGDAKE